MRKLCRRLAFSVFLAMVAVLSLRAESAGDSTEARDVGWWTKSTRNVDKAPQRFDKENPYIQEALQKYGENKTKRYSGTPLEAALAFLEEHISYFTGLAHEESKNFSFTYNREYYSKSFRWTRFTFDLRYEGVRVDDARASVDVDSMGHVHGFRSSFTPPAMPEDVTPAISGADAVEIVRAAVAPFYLEVVDVNHLVIFLSDPPRLAYFLRFTTQYDESYVGDYLGYPGLCWIDAKTGEIMNWGLSHLSDPPIPLDTRSRP